ncbi:hypothetical protein ACFC6U_27845 [Kitasatospora purpeofusca]|uniref:hypothetical protein n=1 Tax=Kitasatospora purpeofusca TaxID=67352 RepID=UPI0035D6DA96
MTAHPQGWHGQGTLLLQVFAATCFAGEPTNTESDKRLSVTRGPADLDLLPTPTLPATHAALLAHLNGSAGFSTHGWDTEVDPRTLVGVRP